MNNLLKEAHTALTAYADESKEVNDLLGRIEQALAAPVQDWKLVPVDAKPEIMEAAMAVHDRWAWRNFPAMWEAILAAAPQPAQRKPLTKTQREEVFQQWGLHTWTPEDVIQAVEAAIKEKNT